MSNFDEPEGVMTAIRAALVRTESIGDAGKELGYEPLVRMSKGEKQGSERAHDVILADCFEAVIGAIYLDQGYEKAQEFINNFGLAFQIRDDLINVITSKSDIEDGIFNAPSILSDDLSDGIEKTKDLLNNYLNCSKQCIEDMKESPYKTALYELLELMEKKKKNKRLV